MGWVALRLSTLARTNLSLLLRHHHLRRQNVTSTVRAKHKPFPRAAACLDSPATFVLSPRSANFKLVAAWNPLEINIDFIWKSKRRKARITASVHQRKISFDLLVSDKQLLLRINLFSNSTDFIFENKDYASSFCLQNNYKKEIKGMVKFPPIPCPQSH